MEGRESILKCIIIAAHTSNWFLIGRCYGYIQKIYPKYLIKWTFLSYFRNYFKVKRGWKAE